MAKGTREIRRKIKSTKNTKQITKAMELVSASKMRRAVANTLALRPYARLAEALLKRLSSKSSTQNGDANAQAAIDVATMHPLLSKRAVKNVLVILVSTDRGLCGGLNTQLFRKFNEYIKSEEKNNPSVEFSCVAIGKKAQDFLRRSDKKVIAAYGAFSNHPTLADTYPISRMVIDDFSTEKYDKVKLIYTDFISAIVQKPTARTLLPFSQPALEEMVDELELRGHHVPDAQAEAIEQMEYLFEPSPKKVLEMLLPRLTEMQIFQAILEATASEHSARMFAMRNASDNATELIADLTLMYNQMRQAAITAELAEISAGRAALG